MTSSAVVYVDKYKLLQEWNFLRCTGKKIYIKALLFTLRVTGRLYVCNIPVHPLGEIINSPF